jgi:hypothetical protein
VVADYGFVAADDRDFVAAAHRGFVAPVDNLPSGGGPRRYNNVVRCCNGNGVAQWWSGFG